MTARALMTDTAPRVSVCMAVHNGRAFLRRQIDSILKQLRPVDELVVVDDASVDDSVDILRSVGDPRLHVHRNQDNLGVVTTFEKSLRLSNEDILFLSDQDDVWLPGKVEKALAVFASRPDVTLVATDAMLIDEHERILSKSFLSIRGGFAPGVLSNFVRNKYVGCTMSFRRIMLRRFLPIPRDVPMHDMWFGIVNQIYGRTFYIDEPLTAYRRHGRNATELSRSSVIQMAVWRYRLAKNVLTRATARH